MDKLLATLICSLFFVTANSFAGQGPLPVKYRWRYPTSRIVHNQLLKSHRKIIVGMEEGTFIALNTDSGKEMWRYDAPAKVLWPSFSAPGYRQKLAAQYGHLFLSWSDGSVLSLHLDQGVKDWDVRLRTKPKWSPTVTWHAATVVCDSNRIVGLDTRDGRTLWTYETKSRVIDPPATDEKLLIFSTKNNEIHCLLEKTGEQAWTMKVNGLATPPPTFTNKKVIISTNKGLLYAVACKNGRLHWQQQVGLLATCPITYKNNLLVATKDGRLLALDSETGFVRWEHSSGYALAQSPSRFDSVIHSTVLSPQLLVYCTYFGDMLHGVHLETGNLLWLHRGGPDWTVPPAFSGPEVLFGNRDSYLHGMNGYYGAIIWKAKLDSHIVTVPLTIDKRVFVGTKEGTVYAIDSPY